MTRRPRHSDGPLVDVHDLVMLDLDGVVYLGEEAIPAAVETITELGRRGVATRYVTNNASRRAEEVASLLRRLDVPAAAEQVVTSAAAAAALLAKRLGAGAPVLVVGAAALTAEVTEVGLTPVTSADDGPVAVIQGFAPEVGWRQLAEAAIAINAGALWMATNADRTLPTPRGALPGNGALIAALATATGREPDVVVGKPAPTLFRDAIERASAQRPLVVGDRLDTDIAGANAAGVDSLLVLTGVATARDLLDAPVDQQPTYVGGDLTALLTAHPPVELTGGPADERVGCGGWVVGRAGAEVSLGGAGDVRDALRALCGRAWEFGAPSTVRPDGPAAASALRALAL